MSCIVSSTPGRIRLRHARLRSSAVRSAACSALEKMEGVIRTAAHSRACSIVVVYDPQLSTAAALEAAIAGHCNAAWTSPPAPAYRAAATQAPAPQPHPPSPRVRVNRVAKRGMLLGLGASLVLAALGHKRWHAATGLVFVGCLAAHLTVHRRHLLR